jgi:cytochrome c-type biogenesis protein CcmE
MSKGIQIAIGAVAVALLLGWYAATNLDGLDRFNYYQSLEEFRAAGGADARARVHGFVAGGSIVRDVAAREVRFAIQDRAPHAGAPADRSLAVVYASLETPDLFGDGAEVVVEGRLEGAGPAAVFRADNVLAKCPSKFEAKRVEAVAF